MDLVPVEHDPFAAGSEQAMAAGQGSPLATDDPFERAAYRLRRQAPADHPVSGLMTGMAPVLTDMAKGVINTVAYPSRLLSGQEDYDWGGPQSAGQALNTAMLMAGARAPAIGEGEAGIFGGRLAKTEDLDRVTDMAAASPPVRLPSAEMLRAYQLGKDVRAAKINWRWEDSPTGSFENDLAYDHLPKAGFTIEDIARMESGRDPVQSGFYLAGRRDYSLPIFATGHRFGEAPKDGRSWNYQTNEYENGVSMAGVDHPDFKDYFWADMGGVGVPGGKSNRARPRVDYEGWLLPWRGSDDEPLMVGVKPRDQQIVRYGKQAPRLEPVDYDPFLSSRL